MQYLQSPDVLLLSLLASGVALWIAATIGPSLRLCFFSSLTHSFADRMMLVHTQTTVVGIYIFNYTLLLVWGLCCVMVEVVVGSDSQFTAVFTASLAFAVGLTCAIAHLIVACQTGHPVDETSVEAAGSKQLDLPVRAIVARVAQLPDGTTALAVMTEDPAALPPPERTLRLAHCRQGVLKQRLEEDDPRVAGHTIQVTTGSDSGMTQAPECM